jgi:hypothetical protein
MSAGGMGLDGGSQCNSNERTRRVTHEQQVAVKKLIQQHFSPEQMKDFLDEINMMKYAAILFLLLSFSLFHFYYLLVLVCFLFFSFVLFCFTAVNAQTTRAGSCTIPTWCC